MWRYDRSWIENFLSSWAVLLLAAMSVTSLGLRYVREPISCHYVYPQANDYFTDHCFHQTSIIMRSPEFVEFCRQTWAKGGRQSGRGGSSQGFPNPFQLWPKQRTYHQWVPLALGTGALLCLVPHVAWRLLNALLWLDGHALLKTVQAAASHSDSASPSSSSSSSASGSVSGGSGVALADSAFVVLAGLRGGNTNWLLTGAAVGRKALACAVCALQVVLIAVLFNPPLGGDGENVEEAEQRQLLAGGGGGGGGASSLHVNLTAPEVLGDVPLPVEPFFCTVDFTHNQNSQSMTMQCLLPLNKVYAQAFVFLFYFFLLLLALCAMDVVYWLGRIFLPSVKNILLTRNLSVIGQSEAASSASPSPTGPAPALFPPSRTSTTLLFDFAQSLGPDGRLLLALVADHCGPVASLRFTSQLLRAFKVQACLAAGRSSRGCGDVVGGGEGDGDGGGPDSVDPSAEAGTGRVEEVGGGGGDAFRAGAEDMRLREVDVAVPEDLAEYVMDE